MSENQNVEYKETWRTEYLNLDQVTVTAMQKAERGCATYTPMMFYKVYRLLAKIAPSALMVKFTSVEGSTK